MPYALTFFAIKIAIKMPYALTFFPKIMQNVGYFFLNLSSCCSRIEMSHQSQLFEYIFKIFSDSK